MSIALLDPPGTSPAKFYRLPKVFRVDLTSTSRHVQTGDTEDDGHVVAFGEEVAVLEAGGGLGYGNGGSYHLCFGSKTTASEHDHMGRVTSVTVVEYRNIDPGEDAPSRSADAGQTQYRFVFSPPVPWQATWGSLTLHYRIYTTAQSGTRTTTTTYVYPDDTHAPTESSTVECSETATGSYEPQSTTLSLNATTGNLESDLLTVRAGAYGETKQIVGTDDVGALKLYGGNPDIYFETQTCRRSLGKSGFGPYLRAWEDRAGAISCYQTQTASTADAPAGAAPYPVYSGADTFTQAGEVDPETGLPRYVETGTFSPSVPDAYRGSPAPEVVATQAVSATATVAQWPAGLVMTLSDAQPTSAITGPVDAVVAAHDFTTPDSDGNPQPRQVSAPHAGEIARRYLPADELSYVASKGRVRIATTLSFDSGIASLFLGQPPQSVTDDSIALTWTRITLDLDTGARSSSASGAATLRLQGLSNPADPSSGLGGSIAPTAYTDEPVPTTNIAVTLATLTPTGTVPSMRPPFYAVRVT